MLLPPTDPEHPLIVCALAKLSFAGGSGGGGAGGGATELMRFQPNVSRVAKSFSVAFSATPEGTLGSMMPINLPVRSSSFQWLDCFPSPSVDVGSGPPVDRPSSPVGWPATENVSPVK